MTVDATLSGVSANSYSTLLEADTYHSARGNNAWAAATDAAKNSALIRATDYIEALYSGRWKGDIVATTQALSWPRTGVIDANGRTVANDSIPANVKYAQADLALIALSRADLTPTIDDAAVKRSMNKVGSIETETEYASAGSTAYRGVNQRLVQYTTGAGAVIRA